MVLPDQFYRRKAVDVAPLLLGKRVVRVDNNRRLVGRIVETEAYSQDDPASHSFKGATKRCMAMFGRGGIAYLYLIYGIYHCFNIVTGEEGEGEAVLIRALEPVEGSPLMWQNRFGEKPYQEQKERTLCSGPGKLCKALKIDIGFNYHPLNTSPLKIEDDPHSTQFEVVQDRRIGISVAENRPWRFLIKESPFVSKKQGDS